MAGWNLDPEYTSLKDDFGSLEEVFSLKGEQLTHDSLSEVIRVARGGVNYYVKRYVGAGKGLRRYLGRPRVKSEWQNLKRFAKWGIPTAEVVAWGMKRSVLSYDRGALITRELPNTQDLSVLAERSDVRIKDAKWVDVVSRQLAEYTRIMHDHSFAHNDLKWRNILVDDRITLYLIDCPKGDLWHGLLLKYRITKDLACLDKVAKYHLSATQRLRFYLRYRQSTHLRASDKQRIRDVVSFFEGRE